MIGVQAYASSRNEQVEVLVDFVLRQYAKELEAGGSLRQAAQPERQVTFVREDASDVFDHFLDLDLSRPIGALEGRVQLWGQTTCYKGNVTGRPESNKTYEIRETLIEALFLRRWLRDEGAAFRTLHFTVGPAAYAYGWFKDAKDNAFDLSVYVQTQSVDIFEALAVLFAGATVEAQLYQRLATAEADARSEIGGAIRAAGARLMDWTLAGMVATPLADQQAQLLRRLATQQSDSTDRAVVQSREGGSDIKGRAVQMLTGQLAENGDDAMVRALARLNVGNPFLAVALRVHERWGEWASQTYRVPTPETSLEAYVKSLWKASGDDRLVNRRLLVRIHSDDPIRYVQDVGVAGVTEHNLYAGNHTDAQVEALVVRICASCRTEGIDTAAQLSTRLQGRRGRRLLQAARQAEVVNGANLKPSFFYVEERLRSDFQVLRFLDTDLPPPRAYHAAFGSAVVLPYQNLRVIASRSGRLLAILKVKYFREQEFPRRAKEEGYVALTTRFEYAGGKFIKRYLRLPLIMFVDMDAGLVPPLRAVRRLSTCGWDVYFSVEELGRFLQSL